MAGRKNRITSQNSTLPALRLMGAMPASSDRRSSSVVAASARVVTARSTTASSQATSASTAPATRWGT